MSISTDSWNWPSAVQRYQQNFQVWYMTLGILYIPVVFGLKHLAIPFPKQIVSGIRGGWAVWNAGLAVFSMLGVYYTTPAMLWMAKEERLCRQTEDYWAVMNGESGKWIFYFIASKLVELGDSVFLALLDKPIPFLHWYHHWITMMINYLSLDYLIPYYFPSMYINYMVHSIMYMYYAFSALGMKWVRVIAMPITVLQTAQMVGMTGHYIYWMVVDTECRDNLITWPTLAMYAVYLVLFARYFWMRYVSVKVVKKD